MRPAASRSRRPGPDRAHIERYGTGPCGRLFRTARGEPLNDTGYVEVWQRARPKGLTAAEQATPLARRSCDLRHAAVSLWLNAGVPATEVARRAGHGIAVLLKVYANCIDRQATTAMGASAKPSTSTAAKAHDAGDGPGHGIDGHIDLVDPGSQALL